MFRRNHLISDFIIDPGKLQSQIGNLVYPQVLSILSENKIQLKLNVFDSEPGITAKPVMVLIHGNSTSKKLFSDHISHFSKKYRVIAMDLLGHGDSTKISELENISANDKNSLCEAFYNPFAMIAELAQLLEARGILNAHIIGWSLGGHMAYGIANLNPSLVASIVSIGSPPVKICSEGLKKGFGEWFINILLPEWVNQPKIYSLEEARFIGRHIGLSNTEDIEIFAKDMVIADPQIRRNLFLKVAEYDNEKYNASSIDGEQFIQQTTIPLCLMVGGIDAGINTAYISSMSEKLRHSQSAVHIIENAPHALFKTHSEQYYQIVDGFIERTLQLCLKP